MVHDGSCPPVNLPKYNSPLRVESIGRSGISAPRNEGIRRTRTPLTLICVEPEFYQRIVSTFAWRPSADVVHLAFISSMPRAV